MSADNQPDLRLEIAHVLFIDIVGYSKLLIDEQTRVSQALTLVVRKAAAVREAEAAGQIIRLPTGDGMALVFTSSAEAPVECALQLSEALRGEPAVPVRMGIHSGPVHQVADVNERTNIAGAGINIAKRVMDCGDAGHILLSKHVAEDLESYARWQRHLRDLGECEVKHGSRVHLYNLFGNGFGNPEMPLKLSSVRRGSIERRRLRKVWLVAAFLAVGVVLIAFLIYKFRRAPPASSGNAIPEKSIAVLPFENLSGEADNAYFSEGVQEEILSRLAGIEELRVISRTSTQQYRSKPGNLSEIAKQLGVAHILEGSVQKQGDQVRVNVQLINAQTDAHLWADTYDRELTDIFGVETEIANGIARSLQAKLTGRAKQAEPTEPTNNPKAYDAYLRGLAFYAHSTYSDEPIGKAIDFFEMAVQLDPNFAPAWARLSRANAFLYFRQGDTTETRRNAVKRALDNAQKLQPNSPDTLLALGYYQYWVLRDFQLARTTFNLVSKMLPGSSDVPFALGAIARRQGHWDESISFMEQALLTDPRNTELLIHAADTYGMMRRFPAALKLYNRALDISPNDSDLLITKAGIYQAQGNLEEAAKWLPQLNAQSPDAGFNAKVIIQVLLQRNQNDAARLLGRQRSHFHFGSGFYENPNLVNLALTKRLAGDFAGAKAAAEEARIELETLCQRQPDNVIFTANLSQAYALLGNKEGALKEAERAITLLPTAKDAVDGPEMEENMALIATLVGEHDRALVTLGQLLETPYDGWYYLTPITPALLKVDPTWDSWRGDPAFQKLCQEKPR